jgi:surface protein
MAIPNYSGIKHFHDGGSVAGRGSGDVIYEGTTSVTAGVIYYLDDDGEWEQIVASYTRTSKQLLAVALGTGNSNVVGMLLRGMVTLATNPGSSSAGLPIYISKNAGEATVTAPIGVDATVRIVGYSVDGEKVWFDPSPSYITGGIAPFAFTVKTDNTGVSTSTQFKLPLTTSTGLNAVVDWGDSTTSTITSHTSPDITHTYATAGTYSISITGTLPGWRFNDGGDKLKILNISSWGVLDITTNGTFYGCTNLTSNATDYPTITTTDLSYTFRSCSNFNSNIGNWDISAIINLSQMFFNGTAFNNGGSSSIGSWNTAAVTNMSHMFYGTVFNQPIGSWNTAEVTTMNAMFNNATAFNQSLSFDTSAVTDMSYMFRGAISFNQALNFDTAAVTNMAHLFNSASNFNSALTFTNTEAVTNMSNMFNFASDFNQSLSFDTSAVTNMSFMFSSASDFNQTLEGFNTSSVTNMSYMFAYATAFNPDGLSFDTSAVTNMSSMFQSATAFQQDIGDWDVSNVTNFLNFMAGKTPATFPDEFLDSIYNGWLSGGVKESITISFGTAKYGEDSESSRTSLVSSESWTITDGGKT